MFTVGDIGRGQTRMKIICPRSSAFVRVPHFVGPVLSALPTDQPLGQGAQLGQGGRIAPSGIQRRQRLLMIERTDALGIAARAGLIEYTKDAPNIALVPFGL